MTNKDIERVVEEFKQLLVAHQSYMEVFALLDKPQLQIRLPFAEDWLRTALTATRQAAIEECVRVAEGMLQSVISHGHPLNNERTCDTCGWNSALTDLITTLKADK